MSMNINSNKEKNLINLSIIRCNKITIKKVKCLKQNMKKKYFIKLYSNNTTPQISKTLSFKESNEIEINQSFPLDTFQQKIINEIKFEFCKEKDDSILYQGMIINQKFIFDETSGDYILHLYDDKGNDSVVIYYSVEYTAIDSFETFDKSVKYNQSSNNNDLQKSLKDMPQEEIIKNEFILNLQYLENIVLYFVNIIRWENTIDTLLFLISITFIILYFKIFYIYVFPISIVFFHIKNKAQIKNLINSKKNEDNLREKELFFVKLQMAYNNLIEFYEYFIQKVIAGNKSMIIEIYKSLILTIFANIILFYFKLFYLIRWKWVVILSLWAYFLSYNLLCCKIYDGFIQILSPFSSIVTENKLFLKIKPLIKNIINILVPFYPLYYSIQKDNSDVYLSMVKGQGFKAVSSNELRLSKSINYKKSSSIGSNLIKFELYENEKWWILVGWTKNLAGERPAWSTVENPYQFCDKTKIFLPNDENNKYQWSAEWKIEKSDNTDSLGWEYADNFDSEFSNDDKFKYARRRKWVRYANKI